MRLIFLRMRPVIIITGPLRYLPMLHHVYPRLILASWCVLFRSRVHKRNGPGVFFFFCSIIATSADEGRVENMFDSPKNDLINLIINTSLCGLAICRRDAPRPCT